jgi:branched-chain amino acid transport system substrate-binding protein
MKYRVLLIAALIIAAALIAGCSQSQPATTQQPAGTASAGVIRVGVIASLTGPASNVGTNMWQSAQVAADKINADGGVAFKDGSKAQIKLIVGDDESTATGGQKAATKLITDDKADILVGGYSSAVTSSYEQTIADNRIPFIVTGASSPIITHRTDGIDTSYVFHHCPTTDTYGEYTTQFINQVIRPAVNKKLGAADSRPFRLALLYQDTAFGKGVQTAVNNTISKNNLNIQLVSQQSYKMGDTDFRTQLTAIKAANPDAVYLGAFPNEGAPAITQARRDIGLNSIFLNVENNDNAQFYKDLGQYGEGVIIESRFSPYTAPAGAVTDAQTAFKQAYFAKFGTYPDMMGASTYDGIFIAAKAIGNAGTTDKAAVRQALIDLKMPQVVHAMKDQTISFSPGFRESTFDLWMEQLAFNTTAGETRPSIVWPDNLKTTEFVLPSGYVAGSSS